MSKLVVVRHGKSVWNKENKFTGWVDVDLATEGVEEAMVAGQLLQDYTFDCAFTSALMRAQKTLDIILAEIGQTNIPVTQSKALNERMYGDLQGLDKDETREKFGAEQVHIWRRSYDIAPPNGESLKDTEERVMPYYLEKIEPLLKSGQNILISAHGNSLRALTKYLENLTPEEVVTVEIPTGKPKVYEFDEQFKLIKFKFLTLED